MKKLLILFLVLLAGIAYGQQSNTTNTKFINGLASSSGPTLPTTGISAGMLHYKTTAPIGMHYYTGSAWVLIGTGTVASFSAGTLSPLFTTSVATATTTPALSFTLSNAGANTVFGNSTGSSAAPSFFALGTLSAGYGLTLASGYNATTDRTVLIDTTTLNLKYIRNSTSLQAASNYQISGMGKMLGMLQVGEAGGSYPDVYGQPSAAVPNYSFIRSKSGGTTDGNVLMIQNMRAGEFSAIRAADRFGHEKMAIGYGNPPWAGFFAGKAYWESYRQGSSSTVPNITPIMISAEQRDTVGLTTSFNRIMFVDSLAAITFYDQTVNFGNTIAMQIGTGNIYAKIPLEMAANLLANSTNTYDIGVTGTRFRNGWFSGNVAVADDAYDSGWNGDLTVPTKNAIWDAGFAGSAATFTLGSTSIALGSTTTTVAGLSSVTSTSFVGALTGNASTVTTNANLTGAITSVGNATSSTITNPAITGASSSITNLAVSVQITGTVSSAGAASAFNMRNSNGGVGSSARYNMMTSSAGVTTGYIETSRIDANNTNVIIGSYASGALTNTFTLSPGGNIAFTGTTITSGAIVMTATNATGTLSCIACTETLSNKTLTTPVIGAATGTSLALTGVLNVNGATPDGSLFQVYNGTVNTFKVSSAGLPIINYNNTSLLIESAASGNSTYIQFAEKGVADRWAIGSTNGDGNFYFRPTSYSTAAVLTLSTAGLITTSLGSGAVQATAGVLSVVSDSRLKLLSGTYKGSALSAIMKLESPQYWKYSAKSGLPKIAQDVKQFGLLSDKVYTVLGEEFAPTQKDGMHSLSDRALLSLTIQALQEANKKIDVFQTVNNGFQKRIIALERK